MKKNFIVTTGIIESWEFSENNFTIGRWCEYYETDRYDEDLGKKIKKEVSVIKNKNHWSDIEKRKKDHIYLEELTEYFLEILSKKLSKIHNINEGKEYWRQVIYSWLGEYATTIFDRWEHIRIFFEKNKKEKFYTNVFLFNNLNFLPKTHEDYNGFTQQHAWNHLIFLRIFNELDIENLSLIKKNLKYNEQKKNFDLKSRTAFIDDKSSLTTKFFLLLDKIFSKFAFKFNKIIFETFYLPKMEFLKICLKFKLFPNKYINFFDFNIESNHLLQETKRNSLKELLSKIDHKDRFVKFLLSNIHKDIPMSYLENFDSIQKKILPYSKMKKTIFSMHSIYRNDNFKIYLAEAKKNGSKYIHVPHGGGLTFEFKNNFSLVEKLSDKIVRWDYDSEKNNLFSNLSVIKPLIKIEEAKGSYCTIVATERKRYVNKFPLSLVLEQAMDFFNDIIKFGNGLDAQIRSNLKYRSKTTMDFNSNKKFEKVFGKESVDRLSKDNSFSNTILNSKLIIVTYPQSVFSEAMYSNVPTILIFKKDCHLLSKNALDIFYDLKRNKIAFEDFEDAKIHINKNWKELNLWWKNENVQAARKRYLENFFNVKSDWYKEWCNFIYHASL